MLPLWLLAAHLVGDYVLQTRWQAAGKFTDVGLRARHVTAYCVPFVPLAIIYGDGYAYSNAVLFLMALWTLHYWTDSRRFASTLGDVVGWRLRSPEQRHAEWSGQPMYGKVGTTSDTRPPNPWPSVGLAIDQSLHIVQVAVLAAVFLT